MHRFATTTLAAAALLLAALPAQAGFRSGVDSISAVGTTPPATIKVYNDGSRYTHITPSHVWFTAQTAVECKNKNELQSTMLAVGKVTTAKGQIGPPQGPFAHVPAGLSTFETHVNELFAPPRKTPIEMCSQELERRVGQGDSRFELLQHGFDLLFRHDLTFLGNCKYTGIGIGAELDSSGLGPSHPQQWPYGWPDWDGWGSAGTSVYSTIRCEGRSGGSLATPPAPPPPPRPSTNDLAVPFQVTRALLHVSPKKAHAECPATVTANGSITVVGEGTVKYRVEHNGALGPMQQMHFGPGPRSKVLSFDFQVGAAQGGNPGGLSEAAPAGGAAGGIGGFTTQEAPADKVSGSLRLLIVSPQAGVDHSNPTGYNITCSTPPTPGPGTVTSAPRPTHGRRN